MTKFFKPNLIFVIISSFLIAFSSSKPQISITSCLTNNHVTNFTVHSNDQLNSTSNYNNLLAFSLQNLRFSGPDFVKPSLIILPQSKEQLVSSLLCSKNGGFEVRIRCGGHSSEGLSSTNNDGKPFVVIDLMGLDRVTVDLKSETAWVQGGATLGLVYSTIAEQTSGAYGFAAGICPTVGSGGHISGGGYGFLTRKYGLAADNVVDAILVDYLGRVLDRAAMGEDVFWAIRGGGGGSFGIVYAWKIRILKVPPTVTAIQASRDGSIEEVSQLINKWQGVAPYLDDNIYLSVSLAASPNATGNISATFIGLYQGPKLEAKSIVEGRFPELKFQDNEGIEMSWIQSVLFFARLNSTSEARNRYYQAKNYFKAKADYVKASIPIDGIKGALGFLAKEPKGMITVDPYGGIMSRIPSDSIPYPHRAGNIFDVQYFVMWGKDDDQNRDKYLSWIRQFYAYMTPFVSSNPRAAYINQLDLDLGGRDDNVVGPDAVERGRVWGEKYFDNNYDRLVKAKTQIDPCNFFRHPQGIPPKYSPACNKPRRN